MTRKEQLVLDPSLAPPEIPEIRERVHAWLDAKDEARAATERVKIREDVLIAEMVARSVDRYEYVDSRDGKKKHVLADRTPKAKVINAPTPKKRKSADPILDELKEVFGDVAESITVESRRVPRTKEHDDLADPFAATRGMLDS